MSTDHPEGDPAGDLADLPRETAEDFALALSRFLDTRRRIEDASAVAGLESTLPVEARDHRQTAERFRATAAHYRRVAALQLQAAAQQELMAELLLGHLGSSCWPVPARPLTETVFTPWPGRSRRPRCGV